MIIKKVNIERFRGIENYHFELNDKLNVFCGKNGIGKSSIIDAIMWVLCDETLVYGKQNADNRNSNNLKDEIKVSLELDNGVVLERTYFDKWKEDADGNLRFDKVENKFAINGAKYSSKDYFDYIKYTLLKLDRNIVVPKDYNILRSLMDYNYFGGIDYKVSRAFLEQLLGLTSDDDILKEEKFAPIRVDMQVQKYDISKVINKFKRCVDDDTKELDKKETLLYEYEKQVDKSDKSDYDKLIAERDELFNAKFENEPEYLALNRQLEEIGKTIQEEEKNVLQAIFKANQEIQQIALNGNNCNSQLNKLQQDNEYIKRDGNKAIELINELKKELEKTEDEIFIENKCPECGYLLNADGLEEFNKNKEQKSNEIKEKITIQKELIAKLHNDQENIVKQANDIKKHKEDLAKQYFAKKDELVKLNAEKDNNTKVKELTAKKLEIEKQIETATNFYNGKKNERFSELNNSINELSIQGKLVDDIKNLKVEIKELKVDKAISEKNMLLTKEFKELKLQMIKDNISKVFPKLDIEIIEENENTGSIKEVCYLKLKGVEYKGINDGHRKLIGITFIENVKQKLNIPDLPIIFDKYADIDNNMLNIILDNTNSQVLTTKVTNDNEIKIEKGDK